MFVTLFFFCFRPARFLRSSPRRELSSPPANCWTSSTGKIFANQSVVIEEDKIANIAPSSDVKPSAADCQEIFFIRLDKRKVGPSGRLLIAMAAKRARSALIHSNERALRNLRWSEELARKLEERARKPEQSAAQLEMVGLCWPELSAVYRSSRSPWPDHNRQPCTL